MCCGEADLRDIKHERTRDADGIVQLYRNERQGDWTLKGKVILVTGAQVAAVRTSGGRVVVEMTGFDTLLSTGLRCTFHKSQTRRLRTLLPGDVIAFKAICDGLEKAVVFRVGVLIGVERPLE